MFPSSAVGMRRAATGSSRFFLDHIHQLMDLEKERGLKVLAESEREISEQLPLLARAKREVIDLRTQAPGVGEAELAARVHGAAVRSREGGASRVAVG
jgi:hypothetical protein